MVSFLFAVFQLRAAKLALVASTMILAYVVVVAALAANRPQELNLPLECWVLLAANVFYAFAYDTEYAMVDRDDDAKIGIHTSALTLGRWDVAAVIACYCATLAILAAVGWKLRFPWPFYAGIYAALVLVAHQWWLIRHRKREDCFRAFRYSHWIGAAVFAGIVAPVFVR